MFGRMLRNMRHAAVIFGVMLLLLVDLDRLGRSTTTPLQPNPALTRPQPESDTVDGAPAADEKVPSRRSAALPVDQTGLGNLEGKELRFGPSAGPTWAAVHHRAPRTARSTACTTA